MNSAVKIRSIRVCAASAALLALMALASPARAADPVFPPGSRIGLVPPAGMVTSHTFNGFEDPDNKAAIVFTALPAAAYDQMEKAATPDALEKQGITLDRREPIQLGTGKGFLVVVKQVADKEHYRKWLLVAATENLTALVTFQAPDKDTVYPDTIVRAALSTLAVRTSVPDAERLSLLPFTIGDLAGFHIDDVLPGRALMLIDVPDKSADAAKNEPLNAPGRPLDARLLIAALPGGPNEPSDRGNFARLAFNDIGGIKDIKITMSEPLRIGGQPGFETVAEGKDTKTSSDIKVVQWLRFGSGGFLQMVGIVRAEVWTDVFARLRTVRDSIDPK